MRFELYIFRCLPFVFFARWLFCLEWEPGVQVTHNIFRYELQKNPQYNGLKTVVLRV